MAGTFRNSIYRQNQNPYGSVAGPRGAARSPGPEGSRRDVLARAGVAPSVIAKVDQIRARVAELRQRRGLRARAILTR